MQELLKYYDVPKGICFTKEGDDKVYYEDTQNCDSTRHFHSYKNGELFRSSDQPICSTVCKSKKEFYCCTVKGDYIPKSVAIDLKQTKIRNERLKRENKALLQKPEYTCTYRIQNGCLEQNETDEIR